MSAIVVGKRFVIVQILSIITFAKNESTIDLALSISMKGMSNEAIGDVLKIQSATLKRWVRTCS